MESRCDGRMICEDKSYEEKCRYLVPMIGYDKFLVPPPKVNYEETIVNFTMHIEK